MAEVDALGPVIRYDTEHDTQLLATLHGYVAADHNGAEAARRLYIHPNTLAYRMRTIRRLLGGDPCRGDLRLQVELALKLRASCHTWGRLTNTDDSTRSPECLKHSGIGRLFRPRSTGDRTIAHDPTQERLR